MSGFPDLRRVQTLFWRLLTAPEGAASGVASLERAGELTSDDLSFLVRGDARLGAVERLDVYADMYFYRLRDALAEDFPALAARLGTARFHNLVTDYLLAHPPRHFSLRELGRALPDFLDGHACTGDDPILADLARLEWARVDVFDAAPSRPLTRAELLARAAAVGPEPCRVALVPAARLLRLDASAPALWRQRAAASGDREDAGPAVGVVVWRKDFAVLHRSLAPDEEAGLRELEAGGASLAVLGERVLAAQPPDAAPARAAERLAALLEQWTHDELLTTAS